MYEIIAHIYRVTGVEELEVIKRTFLGKEFELFKIKTKYGSLPDDIYKLKIFVNGILVTHVV